MDLKLFDFQLDKNKIALEPVSPRDHSRLLVLDKNLAVIAAANTPSETSPLLNLAAIESLS